VIGPRPVSFERERFTLTPATLSKERLQQLMAAKSTREACLARLISNSRPPSLSDGPASIGKDREFGENRGEPFDQRQQ
jgi:hypothetical protein